MPCPTCDHTMSRVDTAGLVWWCPRCGTLSEARPTPTGPHIRYDAPHLAERCRSLQRMMQDDFPYLQLWRTLGIAEAIHKPANRI